MYDPASIQMRVQHKNAHHGAPRRRVRTGKRPCPCSTLRSAHAHAPPLSLPPAHTDTYTRQAISVMNAHCERKRTQDNTAFITHARCRGCRRLAASGAAACRGAGRAADQRQKGHARSGPAARSASASAIDVRAVPASSKSRTSAAAG